MIADATGHGIGPALIVAECRAMLRALIDTGCDLAAVAARVNDLLHADLDSGRFVTTCFGLIDPEANRIEFLSAGHGPILVYRAAVGAVEEIVPTNLPAGVMGETEQELADPIQLEPGDLFVLLTDGFTEWAKADYEQYGQERLEELLCRHATLPAADLIRTLYEDVRRFGAGQGQLDDLTAVVIKRI
jgi:phosphoserine phosphatase